MKEHLKYVGMEFGIQYVVIGLENKRLTWHVDRWDYQHHVRPSTLFLPIQLVFLYVHKHSYTCMLYAQIHTNNPTYTHINTITYVYSAIYNYT